MTTTGQTGAQQSVVHQKKGCYAYQWLDNVGMHTFANRSIVFTRTGRSICPFQILVQEIQDHPAVHLKNIRWNDAPLDLLSRELFAKIIMTLLVKELTFYDLSHFVFHAEFDNQRGTVTGNQILYNRICNLISWSTFAVKMQCLFKTISDFNHLKLFDICFQVLYI